MPGDKVGVYLVIDCALLEVLARDHGVTAAPGLKACGSCHLSGDTFYGTRCPSGFPFAPNDKGSQKQALGSSCGGSSRCHEDCGENKARDRAKR